MASSDLLSTMYGSRAIEYLLAVGYMLAFVPFWRWVSGTARPAEVPVGARIAEAIGGWFGIPDGVRLHPAHAWVREDGNGVVTVGFDDFTRAVAGPLAGVSLPTVGAHVREGEPAWTVHAMAGNVTMLSPVEGEVIEVNRLPSLAPDRVEGDPYGEGWLLRVRGTPASRARWRRLPQGDAARRVLDAEAVRLQKMLAPEHALLAADGGAPVHGIGVGLDAGAWDRLVHEFFETRPEVGREGAPSGDGR